MKKSTIALFVLAAVCTSIESFGQFNKGRWLAGGNVSLSASSYKGNYIIGPGGTSQELKTTSTNFSLGPQAGFFVANFLAVGTTISVNGGRTNWDAFDPATGELAPAVSKNSSFNLGPFVRYYLPQSIFFHAGVNFGWGKSSTKGGSLTNEGTSSEFHYRGAVGYAYFLNDYVALEPMIGYQSYGSKFNDSDVQQGSFYLNAAFTVYLGERK
jgi:hypothetical protein